MRAARAVLGVDQMHLAEGVSQPTIQRMKTREGTVCGAFDTLTIDTLTKVIETLERAEIYLMGENARSVVADAEFVSRTQTHLQAITPSDKKKNYGTATTGPGRIPALKRHKS